MDRSEKIALLKSMLTQVAPGDNIESLPRSQRQFEPGAPLEGFAGPPELGQETVDSGLRKLTEGREQELTQGELISLEAIVLPENRPVVFIRNGSYEDIGSPWTHLNIPAVKSRIAPMLRSIGRVEVPSLLSIPYGGTGFIVGHNLLMTNRHVARLFTNGVGSRFLIYKPGDAAVDFKREVDTAEDDQTAYFVVRNVLMIHPYWDMSLLLVDGLDVYQALSLSVRPPEELQDRDVVAIGYPARDDRSDLALQDLIFNKKYNVKRLQPGKLRKRTLVRSFENVVNAVTHDSSTLGGNSGSAVIDVDTGEVVALHFAGEYLKANYAVPTYDLARDRRVVAAKVNFAGTQSTTNDWEPAWQQADDVETASTPRGGGLRQDKAMQQQSPTAVSGVMTQGGGATWTLPLSITVSLGQSTFGPVSGGPAVSAAPGVEAPKMQVPFIYGGLEHRKGYQEDFLELDDGEVVSLPMLTPLGKSVTAKLEDGTEELKYHKFSVVVHRGRRMALFTASNVDWREASKVVDGHKPTRKELTGLEDGQLEQWMIDWRIPESDQLPDIFYTKDGGAFDKGHLVRREDVCWGKNFKDIQKANGDTYHTTNCSPQVSSFNQASRGEDNWGDLEGLVQKQTKSEKSIVFSGPVFEDDDRLFEGRDAKGVVMVRIPTRFWKIIVVKGLNGPEAYGFVIEQDLSQVPLREEFTVPSTWRTYMRSTEEIEQSLHGLAQFSWLKQHDQFNTNEGVRMATQLR
jgi:endonuclease G